MALPDITSDLVDANDVNYECGNLVLVEAGENISAGDAVYIHLTDGKAYLGDTGNQYDTRVSGISVETKTTGQDMNIKTRGLYTTSGLTANTIYYLGATGAISSTRSGVKIGVAQSTTQLFIDIRQDDDAAIGTIKAYDLSLGGIPANNVTAFWHVCDGTSLTVGSADTESPLNGQTLPDLNSTQRFIRGSSTSGTNGGGSHSHSLSTAGGSGISCPPKATPPASTGGASSMPAYYEVVFYIKYK